MHPGLSEQGDNQSEYPNHEDVLVEKRASDRTMDHDRWIIVVSHTNTDASLGNNQEHVVGEIS